MPQQSAGLLMYRKRQRQIEYFLVHPGGPFWAKKNEGVWSIPKGLTEQNEDLIVAATREFEEETGIKAGGPFYSLGSVKLKSGKIVHAWAFEGEWDPGRGITSNYIQIEWPPQSKKFISIPEADQGEWMTFERASIMINVSQLPLLTRAQDLLV